MLQGGACCDAAVVVSLEIGRPSTKASVSVALAAVCDGAVPQTEKNTEMVTME